jgi:hypothetical protein
VTTAIEGDEIPNHTPLKHVIEGAEWRSPDATGGNRRHTFQVLSLDAKSGKVMWTRTAYEGPVYDDRHRRGSFAAPTPVTDGSRVYAVFRDPQPGLAIIDIPGDAFNPAGITFIDLADATGGSLVVSEDGKRGLLFTNATLDERITVIELDQPGFPHRTFPLQKSVLSVGFDSTGTKAIILHARAPGDPDTAQSFDEYIDRKPGYSVFDVASGFSKLQITEVNPKHFTFSVGGPGRAYVTLDGGDAEGAFIAVQQIELDSGVVRTIELGSPPDAIGTLPESNKIFVSQRHPLGRVTFIDIITNEVRTLTGFDLNSQIID